MNSKMYISLVGLLGGGLVGGNIDLYLQRAIPGLDLSLQVAVILLTAFLGFFATPYLTTIPLHWLRRRLKLIAAIDILAAVIGLILGLTAAALLTIPLSRLPGDLGQLLPSAAAIIFGYLGIYLMVMRRGEFLDVLSVLNPAHLATNGATPAKAAPPQEKYILVDTSAIIDGRIADISQTGFIDGAFLIPRFVLNELQRIADSADSLRRARGRRGLEMLKRLQKDSIVPIQISEIDADGVSAVDDKLIKIARTHHYPVITNDYNLNKVAELQGVRVLNVNELANSVKPAVLPGEEMRVRVIQDGREANQGVAYLDDGTMIVVENGRRYVDHGDVDVVVTRVLQTVAGRMIFAAIKEHQRESA
ncbi:MAG TPA: PIN domain-containing protein [Chloroflexia bacterium]|nr:PIN domain-containing protein [Chloroflexia bacterium]